MFLWQRNGFDSYEFWSPDIESVQLYIYFPRVPMLVIFLIDENGTELSSASLNYGKIKHGILKCALYSFFKLYYVFPLFALALQNGYGWGNRKLAFHMVFFPQTPWWEKRRDRGRKSSFVAVNFTWRNHIPLCKQYQTYLSPKYGQLCIFIYAFDSLLHGWATFNCFNRITLHNTGNKKVYKSSECNIQHSTIL